MRPFFRVELTARVSHRKRERRFAFALTSVGDFYLRAGRANPSPGGRAAERVFITILHVSLRGVIAPQGGGNAGV